MFDFTGVSNVLFQMFDFTVPTFFLEWFLITDSIYLPDMEPFRFPVSFCLSFGKLHLSRNFSISLMLSNLLARSFHNIPGDFTAGSQTKLPVR